MSDEEGRPLILSVAFIGDDYSFFVLVNRKGVKSREIPLKEMADGLHQGRVTLLDDFDLPLMERASQRMLQNMHNQLTYQAAHDDLTKLLNRKEFERNLAVAIESAKAKSAQHALFYLDLDQFKIVNNSSGHTAGDELLKMVGQRLVEGLKELPAKVARLGGDEFGILITDVATQPAREIAERVLNLVRSAAIRFGRPPLFDIRQHRRRLHRRRHRKRRRGDALLPTKRVTPRRTRAATACRNTNSAMRACCVAVA